MKVFRVVGRFPMGRAWTRFSVEAQAPSKEGACEWVFSTLGSRHKVPRRSIEIDSVEEVEEKGGA